VSLARTETRRICRRLVRVLELLASGVPVLCTTATANDRVIEDIQAQLGAELVTRCGPLARESLALQMLEPSSQPDRLAWLAQVEASTPDGEDLLLVPHAGQRAGPRDEASARGSSSSSSPVTHCRSSH
jgi:hypothetical protein